MKKYHSPPFESGYHSGEIKEGNETISIEGCKMTCRKKVIDHTGNIVQKEVSITDLGVKKKNGHCYRLYDVEETETAAEVIKRDSEI
ncbi:hypothetical protein Mpet_1509 [Methanolacinia petrolearia DSM 11571]|uniref:Uncharacterized protein n=1 Tax=Methanolacinia petrolearia (strain DSM 11571 / OCM 486 / SEBR 4847) TaxID=679926 RepID=E1RG31_METP4|nr:putative zinc-binding protein [Methanolacinia petrolearia]ADN36266.1 hypothetical protein Mpet_1509 [Methanolacinia petrolearia DSM 11571]